MAYDFFPKSAEELRSKTKGHPPDIQGELFLLYEYLKKEFPSIEVPINLDLSKKSSVNITRALQEETSIKKIKSGANLDKLSMKFGNGSSGNRGVNNRGNLFEPQFADSMLKWWKGEPVTNREMLEAIEDINKTYNLTKAKNLKVDVVGGENTKRPLYYKPKIGLTNAKGTGTDIGKSVTDITLVLDGKEEIYLSLKLGTTVTFFNVGVRTKLPPEDIKAYNIKGDGLKLLKTFGIDEKLFCDVFNGKLKKGVKKTSKPDVQHLMETGIGHGYHIVHKLRGKILSKKMDEAALRRAARVSSAVIHYGGKTGTGKRIDIEMESATYKFKINIRDTQGKDGYPTRMMCDFSYK